MKKRLLCYLLVLLVLFTAYCVNLSRITYKVRIKSDEQYKNELVRLSGDKSYTVDKLDSIMGPYEIEDFIKRHSEHFAIYTPSFWNTKTGRFQANFHAHSTKSDGTLTVQEYLDMAADYADKMAPEKFYMAITDHNTVEGGKEIIRILEQNPDKYKNLKIALGMEVFSELQDKVPFVLKDMVSIHLLALGINPYDEELNMEFVKIKDDKWNYSSRKFAKAIKLMSQKGLIGIAHPARYIGSGNIYNYKTYVNYLFFQYWLAAPNNLKYVEAYYQSYDHEDLDTIGYINRHANSFNIKKIGDIDNHGRSLFER